MKVFLSAIIYCAWVSGAWAVVPGYSDTATTRIVRSDTNTLVKQDTHTDSTPVSASVADTEGGTTATSDASAGFNNLRVRSSSVATDASSTHLLATSLAQWNDHLFFRRSGQDITSGNISVTVHARGVIDFEPPMTHQWLNFDVLFGNAGSGIALGPNGSYDQFYHLNSQGKTWNAADGLAMLFDLGAFVPNDASEMSGLVDFSAGAQITDIALLGPNGQPDPTVTITSASGIVYGVPEPQAWSLAICGVGAVVCLRRVR